MNREINNEDFRAVTDELTDLLHQQADGVEAPADFEVGVQRRHDKIVAQHKAGRFAMAGAAVVLAVVGFAGLATNRVTDTGGRNDTPTGSETSNVSADLALIRWTASIESTTDEGSASEIDSCELLESEAIIWMEPGADPAEIAAVEDALNQANEVADFDYIDVDETYLEFSDYYRDEPEILAVVGPSDLPTSFQLVMTDASDATAVAQTFDTMPSVDEMRFAGDSFCDASAGRSWWPWAAIATSAGLAALAVRGRRLRARQPNR